MKKIAVEIKWGIVFFASILLWSVFERAMGWHGENIEQHQYFSMLFAIPAILIYVLALIDKRKRDFQDKMTWLEGFTSGLIISSVVALLSPLGQLVVHKVLSPDYFQNVIAFAVEQNKMTQEDAEAYFNLSSYIKQSLIGAFGMGFVTSAIVALFVKKK